MRTARRLILIFALIILPGVFVPAAARAQSLLDYFQISYGISGLSQNTVQANQTFYVTVTGRIECKKDLPLAVSDATVIGRVVAKDQSGARQVLNPRYVVEVSPFPGKAGEVFTSNLQVSLQFPESSASGSYEIIGELLEASVNSAIGQFPVTGFLPGSQTVGSVTYVGAAGPVRPGTPNVPGPTIAATAAPPVAPVVPDTPLPLTPAVSPSPAITATVPPAIRTPTAAPSPTPTRNTTPANPAQTVMPTPPPVAEPSGVSGWWIVVAVVLSSVATSGVWYWYLRKRR